MHLHIAALGALVTVVAVASPAHKSRSHHTPGHAHRAHAGAVHKKRAPPPPKQVTPPPPDKAGDADVFEEVEAVEAAPTEAAAPPAGGAPAAAAAAAAPTTGGNRPANLREFVSRLHAASVHLPLAWVLLLSLVDAATFLGRRKELRSTGLYLGVVALLSFAPAILSGLLRFAALHYAPEDVGAALLHRNVMYGSAALLSAALLVRVTRRNRLQGLSLVLYLLCIAADAALISWGGHLGGALVYGDDFVTLPR